MKKIFATISMFMMIVGCGSDSSTVSVASVDTAATVSETAKDLPACNDQNKGKLSYVSETNELFYCSGTEWISIAHDTETRDTVYVFDTLNIVEKTLDSLYVGNAGYLKNACTAETDTANYHVLKITCGSSTFHVENKYAYLTAPVYGDTLVDSRDNKKYKTVIIGTQTWMAENLQYEMDGSRCVSDSAGYCEKYGRVYMLDAALNACPAGWHLPTRDEYGILYKFVDGHNGEYSGTSDLISREGWSGTNYDTFGFSILPAGFVTRFGTAYIGQYAEFWTVPDTSPTSYLCWVKENGTFTKTGTFLNAYNTCEPDTYMSVRCLKDAK